MQPKLLCFSTKRLKIFYFGDLTGAPKKSRTPNLQIRSLTLYPIELWALNHMLFIVGNTCFGKLFLMKFGNYVRL